MSGSAEHAYMHNARSSYPTFISVKDTIWLQLSWAFRGLLDAFRWKLVVSTIAGDAEIRANVLKSLTLNSLSLISVYTLDLLLLPLMPHQQKWLHRNMGLLYHALWLMPVVGTSLYLNSSWCSTIAKRAYTLQYGSRAIAQPQTISYTGLLTSLATSAYRVVMIFTSVAVSFVLGALPIVGPFVVFLFFCWLDSYYFFEFIWIARSYSLSRRIRHVEERWAYYLGFGLPSAALCTWGSPLANAALFALIFPAYVIMAVHSSPMPQDPYNPLPSSGDTVRYPSPFIPIRLPVFAVVIWLNDWLVWALSLGGGRRQKARRTPGSSWSASDSAEAVEEGQSVEFPPVQGTWREARVGWGKRTSTDRTDSFGRPVRRKGR